MYHRLETLYSKTKAIMLQRVVLRQALLAKFKRQGPQSRLPNKSDDLCIL
jgi:hypothetical protein